MSRRVTPKTMIKVFYTFLFLAFFLVACGGNNSSTHIPQNAGEPAYRLDKPDQVFVLPEKLEEISGLSALSTTRLLCNEDETGTLYVYNVEEGRLEETIAWGKDKDYEGVAVRENVAYVLQSNGNIYEVRDFMGSKLSVREYKQDRLKDCDAEGLCFVPGTNRLLIACKEGKEAEARHIHAFDLEKESLEAVPYRKLSFKEMEDKLLDTDLDKLSLSLQKFLNPKGESGILFPSGVAIHPITNELYIVSAKSKLLVVYTARGELKDIFELRNEHFLQPEAIAFTPNGDMYIGNEGNGGKPNILKFIYAKK